MIGAREHCLTIDRAAICELGGLERTKLGTHGGDSQAYRWDNVIFVTASHARGKTFNIYLVDEDDSLLEIYGVTGGQRGWTETYGWVRKGIWVIPILSYLRNLDREFTAYTEKKAEEQRKRKSESNREIGEKVTKFNAMFREVSE